jgi:hypothetical protein
MSYQNIFLLIITLSASALAQAQFSGANQQVDSVQQRRQLQQVGNGLCPTNVAPELYPGETRDLGPQTIVSSAPRPALFEAFVDQQYLYSDNIFLAQNDKQGADVLVSTVNATFAPTPFVLADGTFAPRLGYQHQWFNYDLAGDQQVRVFDYTGSLPSTKIVNLDTFDFNASTVFADAAWRWQAWTLTVGADYRRLLDSENYEEFYNEIVPRLNVRRDFVMSESVSAAVLYEGNFRFTETQLPPPGNNKRFNNRTDQSLAFLFNWRVGQHFTLQPYYRFQWTHYTANIVAVPIAKTHREDWLHSVGLTALFPINDYIAFRAFVSYDLMDTSGVFAQNFKKLDLGGGLNLSVRF